MTREVKMGATDDPSLTVHTKNNFKKKEKKESFHHNEDKDKKQKKTKISPSSVRCYTCDEKGNFARDCPIRIKRHHAQVVEDNEPTNKRFIREKDDSDEEYVLTAVLTGTLSHEEY